jgi:D-alanyl-D-alanine carboxypeptidase
MAGLEPQPLQARAAKPPSLAMQEAQAIDAIIERHASEGDFSGVVLVARGDAILRHTAVGFADRARGKRMRPDTRFKLASITKQITAVLTLRQVAAGQLTLETPVQAVLPEFQAPGAEAVQVRHLLTHASGLPNPNAVPGFYLRDVAEAQINKGPALSTCLATPTSPPGARFDYNNCDYLVLGAMLERLTGKSYAELVRQEIAKPLKAKTLGVFGQAAPSRPTTPIGYGEDDSPDMAYNIATYGAAAGAYGSARDLFLWGRAILTNKLLSADLTQQMLKPHPALNGTGLGSWFYSIAFQDRPPMQLIDRQGRILGNKTLLLLSPSDDLVIVLLANTAKARLDETWAQRGMGFELAVALSRPRPPRP